MLDRLKRAIWIFEHKGAAAMPLYLWAHWVAFGTYPRRYRGCDGGTTV